MAGTHLVVPQEGIAAVGNIYTRRDRRGRGLAGRVTAAVVAELLRRGVPTVALNVAQTNATARRVYERVGFVHEGTLRHGLFRAGAFHDVHRMAILRDEWAATKEPAG